MIEGITFLLECIDLVLIMVAILGSLYIKMFVLPEIERNRDQIKKLTVDNMRLGSRVRILESREMRGQVDKVQFEIVHLHPDELEAPHFPSKEGF